MEYNGGQWTAARYKSFITSILRAGSRRWPPKFTALVEARTEKKINVKTGRLAQHFKCRSCSDEFPAKDIQVDHINPIVDPKKGFQTWDIFINNLFCEQDNLQVLCKACHVEKTNLEKATAKKHVNKKSN